MKEYKESIQNFKNLDIDYSKNEIAEYFYMRYFHAFYLYPDEIVNTKIELTQTPLAYSRWLGLFSKNVHNILSEKIEKFIFSKKFKLVDEQNYKI